MDADVFRGKFSLLNEMKNTMNLYNKNSSVVGCSFAVNMYDVWLTSDDDDDTTYNMNNTISKYDTYILL